MKLADTVKDKRIYGNCGLLPGRDELKGLREGNYIRLKTQEGNCFWALITQRKGNRFIVRLDDSVPEMPRGEITSCGTANIYGIV